MSKVMYFSASALGFFDPEINLKMPDDVVEISVKQWRDVLQGVSDGRALAAENGYPVAVDLPPVVTTPRRVGAPREFLNLFAEKEKLAFFSAAQQSAELQLWWAEASAGNFSLDHPRVAAGLAILVNAGILSQDRSETILGADFNSGE